MNRGDNVAGQLPNPAICRAKPAKWPGVVCCLVHDPANCHDARFFNDVAYCTHPNGEDIITKSTTRQDNPSGHSD
jgi:hypothetical protein